MTDGGGSYGVANLRSEWGRVVKNRSELLIQFERRLDGNVYAAGAKLGLAVPIFWSVFERVGAPHCFGYYFHASPSFTK